MPDVRDIVIIGAGPAGLAAANHLTRDYIVFESEQRPGGLMRSKIVNDYVFDWAGHIFFTSIPRISEWVNRLLDGNIIHHQRESWIYSKNVYTRYPFQANTFGLPPAIIKECLLGLIAAHTQAHPAPPGNFLEWIWQTYGEGIARHFMVPYNEKIWARDLRTMSYGWLDGRVPKPGLSDFIDGALAEGRKDMGPNAQFSYPLRGGMQALADALAHPVADHIRLGNPVIQIDPVKHCVYLGDGNSCQYSELISTVPLPRLISMIDGVPEGLRVASESLDFLPVICVNVGIHRPAITEKHWIYYPEPDFLFHRIFVQGNASPFVCPTGSFSFTAEITHSNTKHVDRSSAGNRTVSDAIAAGLIRSNDRIDCIDTIEIPFGYVVPSDDAGPRVDALRDYLAGCGIHLAGRFAEWKYYNMDHSLDAGWTLADRLST